ncbi:MAG: NAD(+)/NADH kinase [Oscillospiraceae bacterium]
MKKIYIFFNYQNKEVIEYTKKLINYLHSHDILCYINEDFKLILKSDICIFAKIDEAINYCDFILTIGGDGTLMHGAKIAINKNKPIVGINLGRLGFLATIEKNNLQDIIDICDNKYNISSRMLLDVTLENNGEKSVFTAVNDIVVSKGIVAKITDLDIYYNNNFLTTYRCDGLVFSTPTGSTAYSMAAGGPIIDINVKGINFTPICTHSIFNKSIIFNEDIILKVKINKNNKTDIYVTIDGEAPHNINENYVISVKKSDKVLKLIEGLNTDYYKTLYNKLIDKGFSL